MKRLIVASLLGIISAQAAERPNILMFFSDDHVDKAISTYQRQGWHGNQTPNIDRIADEGAVFLRSYCGNSICQPSRASILTGLHSHMHGAWNNGVRMKKGLPVFPRLLRESGYQTAWFGKWHLHEVPEGSFDYWNFNGGPGSQGHYYNPDFFDSNGNKETVTGHSAAIITDKVIEWIENRDPDKPFFVTCGFKTPHEDVRPPVNKLDAFKGYIESFELPETFHQGEELLPEMMQKLTTGYIGKKGKTAKDFPPLGSYDPKDPAQLSQLFVRMNDEQRLAWHEAMDELNAEYHKKMDAGEVSEKERIEWQCRRYAAAYLACIDEVDDNVGRLLDVLDEQNLTENTVVIYASDQGYFLGEFGMNDKRSAYEAAMAMPFIIRWPGQITPGTRHEALIQNIDYAPTFLTMAGLPVPESMQGRPLQPLFKGETPDDWRDAVYYNYYGFMRIYPRMEAITTPRYRLMRCYDSDFKEGDEWVLYDLEHDPHQVDSLYDNPEYAEIRDRLHRKLVELREQYELPADGSLVQSVQTKEEMIEAKRQKAIRAKQWQEQQKRKKK